MKVVAVILAGGQSRRMGQDKALLAVDGAPLLRRVYDVAKACVADIYVVTPWIDRYQSLLPDDCCWVLEAQPHQGPLRAFQQALEQITADWILLLACDLPYLDAGVIQRWLSDLEHLPEQAIAYLSPHPKGWETLCGCYRASCYFSLNIFVQSGEQSLQKWLQSEQVTAIVTVHPRIFTNWNYPKDIEK